MYFWNIRRLKEELIRDGLGQRSMFIGITSVSSVIHYAMLALVRVWLVVIYWRIVTHINDVAKAAHA